MSFLLRYPKLFWTGLALYAVSFFLVAVSSGGFFSGIDARGYVCAWVMLAYPFEAAKSLLHPSISGLVAYFSGTIAGLINPVFLVAAVRRSGMLRTVLLIMIPFCWIVFLREHDHPREGHLLWIIGMLLVLFSVSPRETNHAARVAQLSLR